jgi:hypothetical protein
MIVNWLKKITGVAAIEAAARDAEQKRIAEEEKIKSLEYVKQQAEAEVEKVKEQVELEKMSPKDRATKLGESWVAVLDVKFNEDNIRNGFFELDWNEFFIKELILNGYGTEADPEEEIVDRWFRTIVYDMFTEEGIDNSRGVGYINVVPISKGKSEVS